MTWVRIDDEGPEHPKVAQVGGLGIAVQVAGLAYCNRNLTDGFIPRNVVGGLVGWEVVDDQDRVWTAGRTSGTAGEDIDTNWVAEMLVLAGIWHDQHTVSSCERCDARYPAEGRGFVIHDFPDYQPLKAEVIAEREAKSRAGRAGGKATAKARAVARAKADATAGGLAGAVAAAATPATANGVANVQPVPGPVPVPNNAESEGADVAAENGDNPKLILSDRVPHFLDKLHARDPRWDSVTIPAVMQLAKQFDMDVVTVALSFASEGSVEIEDSAYGWLLKTAEGLYEAKLGAA